MTKTIEEAANDYAANWEATHNIHNPELYDLIVGVYKASAERIMSLPLASRMTKEEKERVRELHYHLKSVLAYCHPSADKIVETTMRDLESIFGKEFFEEK